MEQVVVKIDNLVKRYKELIALDHFSLEIREGECRLTREIQKRFKTIEKAGIR